MTNKRGQFYIVSSIVIILVIIGLLSVTTQTFVKTPSSTIYELGSQLNQESLKIVDHGIYNSKDISGPDGLLSKFTEVEFAEYFLQKTTDTEIALIYGDDKGVHYVRYGTTERGKVTLGVGESETSTPIVKDFVTSEPVTPDAFGNINVDLSGEEYSFKLRPGENFYFIITYQKGQEIFVEKTPEIEDDVDEVDCIVSPDEEPPEGCQE